MRLFPALAVLCAICQLTFGAAESRKLPNFVIIFMDDMGYADIGPFGGNPALTPHLNQMAAEGRKFTNFYVSQAVCSASRASLLTGCYNVRLGILGALGPNSTQGIHADEMTLGEVCQQKGYATACFGKWHLGDNMRPAKGFTFWITKPDGSTSEFYSQPIIEDGKLRVEVAGRTLEMAVKLHVFGFSLPVRQHLATPFGCDPGDLSRWYTGSSATTIGRSRR